MCFANGHMEMATWGRTYWTFQQSSKLGGGGVRGEEKKKSKRRNTGRKEEGDREKNKTSQFEKGIHIGQESTSKIIESWLLKVKGNIFSSLSNQHKGSVLGLEICLFPNLSLLLMSWTVSESLNPGRWGNTLCLIPTVTLRTKCENALPIAKCPKKARNRCSLGEWDSLNA